MKILFKVVLILLFFLSEKGYGQSKEVFTVKTNSSDCEVFVDDVKVGTGTIVKVNIDPKKVLRQIKVTRAGYIAENDVFYYKDKEIEINVKRKTYKSEVGTPPIQLRKVSGESFFTEYFFYDYKEYRKINSATIEPLCFAKSGISGFGEKAAENLLFAISKSGYIDTNSTLFNSGDYKCIVNVSFNFARCFIYQIDKKCSNWAIQLEVSVEYDFKDKFGKKLYKYERDSKSGIYSLDFLKWDTIDDKGKTAFTDKLMQEAISNTLSDELEDTAAAVIFKDDELLNASKMQDLDLISSPSVTDMKSALKATVTIKTNDAFGSGCVVSNDGFILTSYHVISESPDSTIKVITNKGDTLNCKLVRTSKMADLALLKTTNTFPFSFSLKKSVEFEVADEVMAIGTPASMELNQTVSKGIISGIRKGSDGLTLIQTDVSVSPGNSGGPLVQASGAFIGIVNSKISGTRVEGLGFCTPLGDVISRLKLKVK